MSQGESGSFGPAGPAGPRGATVWLSKATYSHGSDIKGFFLASMKKHTDHVLSVHRVSVERLDLLDLQDSLDPL